MIHNNLTKIFRILFMFIITILVLNGMCYDLPIIQRIIISLYIASAFMILDMYIPYVIIDKDSDKD